MKRSSTVGLVLITAATAMTACKERPTRYCVDQNNQVAEDSHCEDQNGYHSPFYHWYYGGARGPIRLGTRLTGGSVSVPAEGFESPSQAGTVRGIFGAAGEHAAGGEGGAHGGGE